MNQQLLLSDVTAIVDTREQKPFDLEPMKTKSGSLAVGDYSIAGLESVVAIERKSLPDFVACCGSERKRFQQELDRLRGWPVSAVVLDFGWKVIQQGDWQSKLKPGQAQSSIAAWIAQGHPIILGDCRETAQRITRGILYYAARYRHLEAVAFINEQKENRPAATDRLSN